MKMCYMLLPSGLSGSTSFLANLLRPTLAHEEAALNEMDLEFLDSRVRRAAATRLAEPASELLLFLH